LKRRLIRISIVFLFILIAGIAILNLFLPESGKDILARIEQSKIEYNRLIIQYEDTLELGCYTFGNKSNPALLLIHGSPGDWSAWSNTIFNDSIRASYFIIAIDRPGYGLTSTPAQRELLLQANAVNTIINHLALNDITIVGHSYGGAVVEQLLVDQSDKFSLALLIATTASPELMNPKWYNTFADWSVVKLMLPEAMNSSNIEMMGLPESLKLLEPKLVTITTPIIYIQGTSDVLVPVETINYFKQVKPNGVNYVVLEDIDHFIPWTDPFVINDILLGKSIYLNEN